MSQLEGKRDANSWRQAATEVVCLQQRVLVLEGQAGELRGVVGRRVTVTGVVLETDGSVTWKEKRKK